MTLEGAKFICLDEAGNHADVVLAKGRKFTMGYYVSCDFVLADERAKGVHCEIECDAFGRVTIRNFSPDKPILVNGSSVEIKRILLSNSKLSILDKEYLWFFPKRSSNEFECLPVEDASTPEKQISKAEQPPNSCPDFKLHRDLPKRLTVHNFAYCIQSDELGNISSGSDDGNETTELDKVKTEKAPATQTSQPMSKVSDDKISQFKEFDNENVSLNKTEDHKTEMINLTTELLETPKINLINCTKDKENITIQKKKNQLLTMCHQSDILITSFSPRTTGVKTEKSFATVIKPKVQLTKLPSTPKSVYSTPRSDMNERDNDEKNDSDIITFHTPSTSKKVIRSADTSKVLRNSSMHLIDLTTPVKLRSATPYLKSALKTSATAVRNASKSHFETSSVISINSSTDVSSVIEGPSDGSNIGITPKLATALNTPLRTQKRLGTCTPKRTPQCLMKKAILTSAKKQNEQQINATPRRDALNRIPLRNNLDLSKTPVTPQASTVISQLPRRQSMSTPTRKSVANRLFENCASTSKLSSALPSSSSKSYSRRSSLNPISAAIALPTSTPVSAASTSYLSKTRTACKTSPLHKVRKSSRGVPFSSHISKTRKSIALSASTSRITSIKEKSPQQVLTDRLVTKARKSLCITPISVRSRNMVAAAKTPPTSSSSIPKDKILQSERKLEQKEVLLPNNNTENNVDEDNLSCTFIIESDEDEKNDIEKLKDIPKNVTFSPEKDSNKNKNSKNKLSSTEKIKAEQQAIEIPVDVEEVIDLVSEKKKNANVTTNEEVITTHVETQKNDAEPKEVEEDAENNATVSVIGKIKSIVTEESFAEEINNDSINRKTMGNTTQILENQKKSSQSETAEYSAEILDKPAVETLDDQPSIQNDTEKTNFVETGFGEESSIEISQTSNCEKTIHKEDGTTNSQCTSIQLMEREITAQAEILLAKAEEEIKSLDRQEGETKFETASDTQKSSEYKPIVEDITLEGSLIEKETKETQGNGSCKQILCKFINLEASLIEENVKSEVIKEENIKIALREIATSKRTEKVMFMHADNENIIEPTTEQSKNPNTPDTLYTNQNDQNIDENIETPKTDQPTQINKHETSDAIDVQVKEISNISDTKNLQVSESERPDVNPDNENDCPSDSKSKPPLKIADEIEESLGDTNKLLEEIEDVLNKSDEFKQKHLNEIEEKPLTEEFESEDSSQEKADEEQKLKVSEDPSKSSRADKDNVNSQYEDKDNNCIMADNAQLTSTDKADPKDPFTKDQDEDNKNEIEFNVCNPPDYKEQNVNLLQDITTENAASKSELVDFNQERTLLKTSTVTDTNKKEDNQNEIVAEVVSKLDESQKQNIIEEAINENQSSQILDEEHLNNFQKISEIENVLSPDKKSLENVTVQTEDIEIVRELDSQYDKETNIDKKHSVHNSERTEENIASKSENISKNLVVDEKNAKTATPRRSVRRASQLIDTTEESAKITLTPRRSTRRSSMTVESPLMYTPTKRLTRRASLSIINDRSISLEKESVKPTTTKLQKAKTPRKQLVIPEEMTILEENVDVCNAIKDLGEPEGQGVYSEEKEDVVLTLNKETNVVGNQDEKKTVSAEIFQKESTLHNDPAENSCQTTEILNSTEAVVSNEKQDTLSTLVAETENDNLVAQGTPQLILDDRHVSIFNKEGISKDTFEKKVMDVVVLNEKLPDDEDIVKEAANLKADSESIKEQLECHIVQEYSDDNKEKLVDQVPRELKEKSTEKNCKGHTEEVSCSTKPITDDNAIESIEESSNVISTRSTILNDSPKTTLMTGIRELLKTPKKELFTPQSDDLRDLALSTQSNIYNEEEGFEKLTEMSTTLTSEILTPISEKKSNISVAKTPLMTGVRELLKTPKLDIQSPRLGGIRDLVLTPKKILESEKEETEKLAALANLVKTPKTNVSEVLANKSKKHVTIVDESIKTPLMTGMRELLKTPKLEIGTPKMFGIRDLVQTPKTNLENEQEEIDKFTAVTELLQTTEYSQKNEEMPSSSVSIKNLLKSPKTDREFNESLVTKKSLEDTPSTTSKNVTSLIGVKELLKTPKSCITPSLRGLRELMQTPKMSSTPLFSGVKEAMNSPAQEKDQELEKYFRTPTAKNIMIPSMPISAVIEKSGDSIEISTEYDLNATNEDESEASNLEELFKTEVTSRFVERIHGSYYDEEDAENEENEDEINKIEKGTLKDNISKAAEEAFDKLIGQESQIQTPVRRKYARHSVSLKTPQCPSPFTAAEVLSDLPKTDVEEWIETLDQAESPTEYQCDGDEEEAETNKEDVNKGTDNEEISSVDYTLNESIIPETCTKVFISEKTHSNKSTASLSHTDSRDPLSNSNTKPKEKEPLSIVTPIDAEISGINLLDQTVESLQDELSMLEEPLFVDEPSMLEEPLIVSDNESEDKNIFNILHNTGDSQDEGNDLSEPLVLSDSDDLNQSHGSGKNKIVETENELETTLLKDDMPQTNILNINVQEISMLGNLSNNTESIAEDPLETQDKDSSVEVLVEEHISILIESDVSQYNAKCFGKTNSNSEAESSKTLDAAKNPNKETGTDFQKEEQKSVIATELSEQQDISETLQKCSSSNITKVLETYSKSQIEIQVEKETDDKTYVPEIVSEKVSCVNLVESPLANVHAKEIPIEETKNIRTKSADIFVDTSATEICEETNTLSEEVSKKSFDKKSSDECQDIFLDNSNIDESFADEAINEENNSVFTAREKKNVASVAEFSNEVENDDVQTPKHSQNKVKDRQSLEPTTVKGYEMTNIATNLDIQRRGTSAADADSKGKTSIEARLQSTSEAEIEITSKKIIDYQSNEAKTAGTATNRLELKDIDTANLQNNESKLKPSPVVDDDTTSNDESTVSPKVDEIFSDNILQIGVGNNSVDLSNEPRKITLSASPLAEDTTNETVSNLNEDSSLMSLETEDSKKANEIHVANEHTWEADICESSECAEQQNSEKDITNITSGSGKSCIAIDNEVNEIVTLKAEASEDVLITSSNKEDNSIVSENEADSESRNSFGQKTDTSEVKSERREQFDAAITESSNCTEEEKTELNIKTITSGSRQSFTDNETKTTEKVTSETETSQDELITTSNKEDTSIFLEKGIANETSNNFEVQEETVVAEQDNIETCVDLPVPSEFVQELPLIGQLQKFSSDSIESFEVYDKESIPSSKIIKYDIETKISDADHVEGTELKRMDSASSLIKEECAQASTTSNANSRSHASRNDSVTREITSETIPNADKPPAENFKNSALEDTEHITENSENFPKQIQHLHTISKKTVCRKPTISESSQDSAEEQEKSNTSRKHLRKTIKMPVEQNLEETGEEINDNKPTKINTIPEEEGKIKSTAAECSQVFIKDDNGFKRTLRTVQKSESEDIPIEDTPVAKESISKENVTEKELVVKQKEVLAEEQSCTTSEETKKGSQLDSERYNTSIKDQLALTTIAKVSAHENEDVVSAKEKLPDISKDVVTSELSINLVKEKESEKIGPSTVSNDIIVAAPEEQENSKDIDISRTCSVVRETCNQNEETLEDQSSSNFCGVNSEDKLNVVFSKDKKTETDENEPKSTRSNVIEDSAVTLRIEREPTEIKSSEESVHEDEHSRDRTQRKVQIISVEDVEVEECHEDEVVPAAEKSLKIDVSNLETELSNETESSQRARQIDEQSNVILDVEEHRKLLISESSKVSVNENESNRAKKIPRSKTKKGIAVEENKNEQEVASAKINKLDLEREVCSNTIKFSRLDKKADETKSGTLEVEKISRQGSAQEHKNTDEKRTRRKVQKDPFEETVAEETPSNEAFTVNASSIEKDDNILNMKEKLIEMKSHNIEQADSASYHTVEVQSVSLITENQSENCNASVSDSGQVWIKTDEKPIARNTRRKAQPAKSVEVSLKAEELSNLISSEITDSICDKKDNTSNINTDVEKVTEKRIRRKPVISESGIYDETSRSRKGRRKVQKTPTEEILIEKENDEDILFAKIKENKNSEENKEAQAKLIKSNETSNLNIENKEIVSELPSHESELDTKVDLVSKSEETYKKLEEESIVQEVDTAEVAEKDKVSHQNTSRRGRNKPAYIEATSEEPTTSGKHRRKMQTSAKDEIKTKKESDIKTEKKDPQVMTSADYHSDEVTDVSHKEELLKVEGHSKKTNKQEDGKINSNENVTENREQAQNIQKENEVDATSAEKQQSKIQNLSEDVPIKEHDEKETSIKQTSKRGRQRKLVDAVEVEESVKTTRRGGRHRTEATATVAKGRSANRNVKPPVKHITADVQEDQLDEKISEDSKISGYSSDLIDETLGKRPMSTSKLALPVVAKEHKEPSEKPAELTNTVMSESDLYDDTLRTRKGRRKVQKTPTAEILIEKEIDEDKSIVCAKIKENKDSKENKDAQSKLIKSNEISNLNIENKEIVSVLPSHESELEAKVDPLSKSEETDLETVPSEDVKFAEEPELAIDVEAREERKKFIKKPVKRNHEIHKVVVAEEKPASKRAKHQMLEVKKTEEKSTELQQVKPSSPQKLSIQNETVEVEKDISVVKPQKSTKRKAALKYEQPKKHFPESSTKLRRNPEGHDNSEEQCVSEDLVETKNPVEDTLLSEVKITEDDIETETLLEKPTLHEDSQAVKTRRGRRKAITEEKHSEEPKLLSTTRKGAILKHIEPSHDDSSSSIKRRVPRKKQVEEDLKTKKHQVSHLETVGTSSTDCSTGKDDQEVEKVKHAGVVTYKEQTRTVSTESSVKKSNMEEEAKETKSSEATSRRRNISKKKSDVKEDHEKQTSDATVREKEPADIEKCDDNLKINDVDDDHKASKENEHEPEETKKGRYRKNKNDCEEESEQPSVSKSPERKPRGRRRKEPSRNIPDQIAENVQSKDDISKEVEKNDNVQSSIEQKTPPLVVPATAKDLKIFEHITAESQEAENTPGRARSVPQRRAAIAYHNYDETSDSEISAKTKKKTDSPRKSLETVKKSPPATIKSTTVVSVCPSSTNSITTARGRTRKPTAKVQKFLEEERAKADTPKKRALLAAAAKTSNIDTEMEASKRQKTEKPDVSHCKTEESMVPQETKTELDKKVIELLATSTPTSTSKGRRGRPKGKTTQEERQDEPQAKKVLELEMDKQESSLSIEAPTPTRVAGRRNAAAAAKARIEEDALAAAAIEPPKRNRSKKITPKVANNLSTCIETDTHTTEGEEDQMIKTEKDVKNKKSSSQKREHRLASASTVEGAEDLQDDTENENTDKTSNKRRRKPPTISTTDSPAVPVKRVRKLKVAEEERVDAKTPVDSVKRGRKAKMVEEEVTNSETPADSKTSRGRGRGRKVGHVDELEAEAEPIFSQQNETDVQPAPMDTSEPVKKPTRTRRK